MKFVKTVCNFCVSSRKHCFSQAADFAFLFQNLLKVVETISVTINSIYVIITVINSQSQFQSNKFFRKLLY